MHFPTIALAGLAASLALATPSCPYAAREPGVKCPYAAQSQRDLPENSATLSERASSIPRGVAVAGKQGAMLMNRIGPSKSVLYIANTDGTNARQLLNTSTFDSHATFSPDGEWITFTSERNGDGNADLYRVHPDGTGLELVLGTSSFEDGLVLSPNGATAAYVSTAGTHQANIWTMDLATGVQTCLTNATDVTGVSWSPNGFFKPAWSPDGQWILFSSDRNTNWTGHGNGTGWEHTQTLSVYVIKPDGNGFRQVATKDGYCLGSPKWSPDGSRIVYYEMPREYTWNSHRPEDLNSTVSQIISVDFATGLDRREETSLEQASLQLQPSYVTNDTIGYLIKGPTGAVGINYTTGTTAGPSVPGKQRTPAWNANGTLMVYELVDFTAREMEAPLASWDSEWDYRFTDVFPTLSLGGKLAITQKQTGYANSSIVSMNPDGTDVQEIFDVYNGDLVEAALVVQGLAGAFQPDWSPDGEWVAFGLGSWFQERAVYSAWIMRATANGSFYEQLTFGDLNSGFPSYSHDGQSLVYRVWGSEFGLRVMNLTDKSVVALTNSSDTPDNLPHFSPDGSKILFTRHTNATNFDIATINPDGTDLQILTTSGANDAHAVWTADGRILYSSGQDGFRTECATYDETFQPYGQIYIMNADGSNKTWLTDSMWEDSMPIYLPNAVLEES